MGKGRNETKIYEYSDHDMRIDYNVSMSLYNKLVDFINSKRKLNRTYSFQNAMDEGVTRLLKPQPTIGADFTIIKEISEKITRLFNLIEHQKEIESLLTNTLNNSINLQVSESSIDIEIVDKIMATLPATFKELKQKIVEAKGVLYKTLVFLQNEKKIYLDSKARYCKNV